MSAIPSTPLTVSVVQNSAGRNVAKNLAALERLLRDCPRSDLVAFPEVFAVRGSDADYRAAAQTLDGSEDGPVVTWLTNLSRRLGAWVLAGSVIERAGKNFFNTSLLFNPEGVVSASYRKIHLFEAKLDSGQVVRERDIYEAGDKPVMADVSGWLCGMAICYDLRFPELFRRYAVRGAGLFTVPSNFTQNTGKDHWEILLRARAVENQSFVVAPNQCGKNPVTGVASYGNSLIVGPWGEVLARAADSECVITAGLDPAEISRTRGRIPVLAHRRL